jgi:hypothetical protein
MEIMRVLRNGLLDAVTPAAGQESRGIPDRESEPVGYHPLRASAVRIGATGRDRAAEHEDEGRAGFLMSALCLRVAMAYMPRLN